MEMGWWERGDGTGENHRRKDQPLPAAAGNSLCLHGSSLSCFCSSSLRGVMTGDGVSAGGTPEPVCLTALPLRCKVCCL